MAYKSAPFSKVAHPGLLSQISSFQTGPISWTEPLTLLSAPSIVLPSLQASLLTLGDCSWVSHHALLSFFRWGGGWALRIEVKGLLLSSKYRLFFPQLVSAVLTRLLSNSWVPGTLLPQPPEPFNYRFTNFGVALKITLSLRMIWNSWSSSSFHIPDDGITDVCHCAQLCSTT